MIKDVIVYGVDISEISQPKKWPLFVNRAMQELLTERLLSNKAVSKKRNLCLMLNKKNKYSGKTFRLKLNTKLLGF